ncbi:MAG: universal stress protein [Candidatus Krumholzibacteriia bacterium]
MRRLEQVLFPTDFSAAAQQAMPAAVEIAAAAGAELHVFHALVLHEHGPDGNDARLRELEREIANRAETYAEQQLLDLQGVAGGVQRDGARDAVPGRVPAASIARIVTAQRRATSAADGILDHARRLQPDLIVMGTHGRRGASHLLLGSAAEEVVRYADCPVLTVREGVGARMLSEGRRFLVPVDFSRHSARALEMARVFAAQAQARIDLLHVIEQIVHPAFYTTGKSSLLQLDPRLADRCRENLEKLAEEADGPDVPIDYHVVEGRAVRDIVTFAEQHHSDAVVIATHGLTGLPHFLLGSVAEKVVRRAPCPVLTHKAFGRSFTQD